MLTRLMSLCAVIFTLTGAQQLGGDNSDPFEQLSEKAHEKVKQFYGDGLDLVEILKDMKVFFNMYKSRFTSILPVNFRHLHMNSITKLMDELVTPYVDLVVLEDQDHVLTSDQLQQIKDNLKLIFIGRFWFSNVAYFNEQKRYLKINQQYFNDDIVYDMMGSLSYNITAISLQSQNKKINAQNFDLMSVVGKLKYELSEEIWLEFNEISKMLIGESTMCVEDFFKQIKKKDLLKELEIIADTIRSNPADGTWLDNFKPFTHTSQPKKETQKYAYSISYEFPKSCFAANSRNRAVHPDFDNDPKDQIFLQWIETAYSRRELDHHEINEEAFEYLQHELFSNTEKNYWIHYFKQDFEHTLEKKIKRNEFTYMDAMPYQMIGDSWVKQEGREHDLELEDTELDHLWQQNQLLKDCLKYSIDGWESKEEFFQNQQNYELCLEQAPDIIDLDDKLLMQEQFAFQENMKKLEAFNHHQANTNRKNTDGNRPGRRDLKAVVPQSNVTDGHQHASQRSRGEVRASRHHQRLPRRNQGTPQKIIKRNFRRNEKSTMESVKEKLSNLLK